MSELKKTIVTEIKRTLRGLAQENEPLAPHTTWGIGGPAGLWAEPADAEALAWLVRFCADGEVPFFVIGNGSNLLAADAGFPGVVVSLRGCRRPVRVKGTAVEADAGTTLREMLRQAMLAGLSGCEFLAGIPGTVGGALATNAGAHGRAIGDCVQSIDLLDKSGAVTALDKHEFSFDYRASSVKQRGVVWSAAFTLTPADPARVKATIEELLRERLAKQPLTEKTAGSVFKNPAGQAAGRLIEDSGCKGWAEDGAVVSEKHANFIVNRANARAADVLKLMERVRERVARVAGITLEAEVELVG
jgi:UDP-N-acetylmuramate dehydrogenase